MWTSLKMNMNRFWFFFFFLKQYNISEIFSYNICFGKFFFFFICFWNFHNFLLCRPSQRSALSKVPSQVATLQKIGNLLWAGEVPDSNPGLQDYSLMCYHWATTPSLVEPPRHPSLSHHAITYNQRMFCAFELAEKYIIHQQLPGHFNDLETCYQNTR